MYGNYISHHGIEGQRWGVRNGPPYPLSVNRSVSRKINKRGYILQKGTQIYRTTGTEKEENNRESMFASFTKQDRDIYNKNLIVNATNPNAKVFDMTMKLKEDLIIPSQKERVNTFIEYMSNPENTKKFNSYLKDVMSDNPTLYKEVASGANAKNFYGYLTFCAVTSGVNRVSKGSDAAKASEAIKQDYFSLLKEHGYNATVDDLDAVGNMISNNPIIIFDRGKTVEVVEVKRIR